MRDVITSMVWLILIVCRIDTFSQELLTIKPTHPIVCYQRFEDRHDHIGVSERFKRLREQFPGRTKTANIEVTYINFPPDNLARAAFQHAVDIWETELISDVPIRIQAEWRPLSSGVLGQAIWGSAYANFGGEQYANVFYPVALAEKIAGREINDPSEPDIFASFNSNASWYYGTDGNTPAGKMDMVTIVLHEIAHGLGFSDSYDVEGLLGRVGLESGGTAIPFVFDLFVEDGATKNLVQDFQSPSQDLAAELQSADLFFNSPLSMAALNGSKPKLYAPSTFNNGSSISHLDEVTFNGEQDANRLMTPHIAFAESIHQPGSILLATLADMGWVYTRIDHQPLKDTERKDGQPYPVIARIRSDNGYDPGSVTLHYTTNGIDYTSVQMMPGDEPDEFYYPLPGTTVNMAYAYYISVDDVSDRTHTNPGVFYGINAEPEQSTHYFKIGPDTDAPEIEHDPVRFISEQENLILSARVTDNQGVSEVIVEYRINGGNILTAVMQESTMPDVYEAEIELPSLTVDDEVEYRLIAVDISASGNFAANPESDFHTVDVTGIRPVRDSYENNFNKPSSDFFGNGFSILTSNGFGNGAIHSNHPYSNGTGPNSESNYTYQLQIPIRIRSSDPIIKFDEIVLVEPGEAGSVFGNDDFYDYVVVEGSTDGGETWKPFAPGYDARAHNAWLMRYNSNISGDNSLATGDSTLFQSRTIDMLGSGEFAVGDEVLIRFRLFADQLAHGWGWAIDNLEIQPSITSIEPPGNTLDIYPVPAADELFVDLYGHDQSSVVVEVCDIAGRILYRQTVDAHAGTAQFVIDLRSFDKGMYILKLISRHSVLTRKFLKSGP